jgi:hypothetical protein
MRPSLLLGTSKVMLLVATALNIMFAGMLAATIGSRRYDSWAQRLCERCRHVANHQYLAIAIYFQKYGDRLSEAHLR